MYPTTCYGRMLLIEQQNERLARAARNAHPAAARPALTRSAVAARPWNLRVALAGLAMVVGGFVGASLGTVAQSHPTHQPSSHIMPTSQDS